VKETSPWSSASRLFSRLGSFRRGDFYSPEIIFRFRPPLSAVEPQHCLPSAVAFSLPISVSRSGFSAGPFLGKDRFKAGTFSGNLFGSGVHEFK
jgi:hypothetical protein